MDSNNQNQDNHQQNLKSMVPADESQLDLYTIPISSGWFLWDSIHETERRALKEFFDGSSFTRAPRVYKEYRDFMISKYREDPSRKLTFTEVRKSLVGDVSLLRKVFNLLENWGLINFNVMLSEDDKTAVEGGNSRLRVEEGAPAGVRVVAMPNSLKPLSVPPPPAAGVGVIDYGFRLPHLASYSDVYGDLMKEKELLCGNCKEKCDSSKYYECTKENYKVCGKCFENGKFGENKSVDDFKLNDPAENKGNHGATWTEAETLLLLESVLKHGDDWELVALNVQTKTKHECISRLIELPFGELMLGHRAKFSQGSTTSDATVVQEKLTSGEPQEIIKTEDDCHDQMVDRGQNKEAEDQTPQLKKKRLSLDSDGSMMKQVARISAMVGPRVMAAAADAAVLELCDGNPFVRDIFNVEDDTSANELRPGNLNTDLERAFQPEDSEMMEVPTSSVAQSINVLSQKLGAPPEKVTIPLSLRMRAGVATALGAAAAHARLLADQEEREIELLMATVIETQLKKLRCKIRHFEDLEIIMDMEHAQIEELKESIIAERMDVLQKIVNGGIPRWRDNTFVKPQTNGV